MIYNDLKGKTALITGASSGLGKRFAEILSEYGVRVILAARNIEKLKNIANNLNNAIALQMDVSDKESVQNAFKSLKQEKIDICINSAGIGGLTPIFEEDFENNFEKIMQINTMGVWYVTKASVNHMKNKNINGSIINISSVRGHDKLKENVSAYCASKAAVTQMSKALVGELSKYNIRINVISPGLFDTELTRYKLNSQEEKDSWAKLIPTGFVAKPNNLDGILLYLASNEASKYVTGSCFTIDGGSSCVSNNI